MRTSRLAAVPVVVALIAISAPMASGQDDNDTSANVCPSQPERADGVLTTNEVENGADVEDCDLLGLELEVPMRSVAVAGTTEDGAEARPTIAIPDPGHGTEMVMFGEYAEISYTVEVSPLGELAFGPEDDPARVAANDPCTDDAWNHLVGAMNLHETFNIKVNTFPSYLNETDTRASFVDGIRAWTQLHNDCGFEDNVDATAEDGGGATAPSSVQAAGCVSDGHDSISVFTFGPLPGGLYGGTCRHKVWVPGVQDYVVDGSDVRLNDEDHAWTNRPLRDDCVEMDIQSVVTHEAGHWWGMDHVNADNHPNLTMRGGTGPNGAPFRCAIKMRTLGKGDVLGMRDWY